MTHKPHFGSKAARPATAAAPAQGVQQTQTTDPKIKVVHHHGPGFMRPQ